MKIASIKFLAAILFSAVAIMPLRAQTNAPAGNGTNPPVAVSDNAQVTNPIAVTGNSNKKNPPAGMKLLNLGIQMSGTSGKSDADDIVAIVGVFVMIVTIIAMGLYAMDRRSKRLHETLRTMIDKGIPIPPEFFGPKSWRSGNDLRIGLFWVGLGIGFTIIGGKVGFILLFMGLAFLIIWLVERKNKSGDQPPKP